MNYVYATLIVLGGGGAIVLVAWMYTKWGDFCYDKFDGSSLGLILFLTPLAAPLIFLLAQGLGQ